MTRLSIVHDAAATCWLWLGMLNFADSRSSPGCHKTSGSGMHFLISVSGCEFQVNQLETQLMETTEYKIYVQTGKVGFANIGYDIG